jgi:glycosyltransferase involved in cell wall biosynthesis
MRILVVNWLDPHAPRAGGAERHLEEVFGRLARRGHEVTLLASGRPGAPGEEHIGGLRVVRAGRPWNFAFVWRRAMRRAGGLGRFDVVVEDLNKLPLGIGRVTLVPTVVLVHHLWNGAVFEAASLPVALLTWLTELGLARTYRKEPVIAVSESGRRDLVRRGFPAARVTVVENGIAAPEEEPAGADERAPIPTFAYIGRLQRYKRLHLLLEAVATLRQEGASCRAIIAGTGPAEARLKRLASGLGLSRAVEFTGFVSDAERRGIFRKSWAHVQPSRKEGWGLTVMEAASAGTCTVAANSAGLCDSVEHQVTGLLVPHRFLPSFADALRFLIRNPAEAWRMGAAAYRRAQEYSWDRAAREVEMVLERARLARVEVAP